MSKLFTLLLILLSIVAVPAVGQDKIPTEEDYYPIERFPIPAGVVLEVGGMAMMADGKLAVSSRRGDIYTVANPYGKADEVEFKMYAQGLHEVLGLTYRNGWLYATQRCELSRLKDENNDGKADLVETVNDGWEINGDYHEYAFGSDFDKDGNTWIVLCLTGSFNSNVKYRGWCLRVNEDGKLIPTCSGIRSPGGIGMNHLSEVFYTDNQGPWNGTCSLKHLVPNSFQGHPGGNRWWDEKHVEIMGDKPEDPKSGSRIMVEAKKIPKYVPPVVLFPYNKMGKSASGVTCDISDGKFGPFKNQMFVGDQSYSTVMRCYVEKVNGYYQGACFMFREGFGSGTLPMRLTEKGSMFVGGTNRGWGSRGGQPFALERMDWSGKVPFEVHEMRAKPDGFELTFTKPIDAASAAKIDSYTLGTYTYIFQSSYGSPEVDHTTPTITKAVVNDDNLSVRLYVDGLQQGHVHELKMAGIRSADSVPLLHDTGYYTLNYIPKE
ncbi:MAG: hypothetical protein ACI9HK_001905 [Pirellulaceae bacterium]|jgi:hypothetical protein